MIHGNLMILFYAERFLAGWKWGFCAGWFKFLWEMDFFLAAFGDANDDNCVLDEE